MIRFSNNVVVRKLQFLNNFFINTAVLQGFILKNRKTCGGRDRSPSQIYIIEV